MTGQEFRELFGAVSIWGHGDVDGQRGSLGHLAAACSGAAARLVQPGVTVSLGRPLFAEARIGVPRPAEHHMTMLNDVDIGSGSLRFAKDYIGIDYHNEGHSHIDALCHVTFDGCFFNGRPVTSVTRQGAGAGAGAIDALENGQVGRAVLLEVPRARGIRWVEPGDTAPNTTQGIAFPIHGLAINAIGIHKLDYLQFGNVVAQSEAGGRWEFFVAATPLRLGSGTGSPFNLIAIF
jgi:hypothetical protein